MKIIKKGLITLLILIVIAIFSAFLYVKSTLPKYEESHTIYGIEGEIEIYRDKNAVPHIYANTQNDLAFGMGYVMAQDRLWQMDLFRRVATGRLSEVFGEKTLVADRFAKTLGFQRNARKVLKSLSPNQMAYMKSFIKGINTYIQINMKEKPIEFTVLSYNPTPFEIDEIIALSNFQAYASNHNWKFEIMRLQAINELGSEKARKLIPAISFNGPYMTKPDFHQPSEGIASKRNFGNTAYEKNRKSKLLENSLLQADSIIAELTGIKGNEVHSNFWLVSGKKSRSGKAILANDYHMPFLLPSLWYEIHLVGDGIDATGITLPGYPTIVAGHNQNIAWAATTSGVDTQDLVIEKLNPSNKNEYLYMGEFYEFEQIEETIKYKSEGKLKTEKIVINISRNGPIINAITKDLLNNIDKPIAFRTIKDAAEGQIEFCMSLYKASNWLEFKGILKHVKTPVWNWGYADINGNIGYKLNGQIPIRKKGYGLEPVQGWNDEYEWTGMIPFDKLPELYNPTSGYIVSANNEIVDDSYEYMLFATNFQLPYRAMRIAELLENEEKITQSIMQKIQFDNYSEFGLTLSKFIIAAKSEDKTEQKIIDNLKSYLISWDGMTNSNSVATTIVQEFMVKMLNNTFSSQMSDNLYKQFTKFGNLNYSASVLLLQLNDSSNIKNRNQIINKSIIQAYHSLEKELGNDVNEWQWGKIHQVAFKHQMGKVAPFKWFWNTETKPFSGDISTVNPGTFTNIDTKPYIATHGASMRHIVDFGNINDSDLVITTGQSGRWLSPYYKDQEHLWYYNKYIKLTSSKSVIKKESIGFTLLSPKNKN